ncbi:uncharacterized protein LOC106712247 [Papilio machaon]|uniref:uncharacterized protein LOC106712247 n=1 Tax=Papilio machaon TaxID=76193 RepID=UPI001E665B94|nr:uncharacterized protein LOC106712247 [Papilio machaon]
MPHDRTYCNMLLKCLNKDASSSVQPDLAASLEHVTKNDIYRILELIHLSNDNQIQIKLISILTIYMMSNGPDRELIIKFNPLYDKMCEILTKGHQKKSNITLNFLAGLLHTEDDAASTRARAQVLYAQNMIRASGCLMAMANLFINGLLHQDTWQALCRCLADSCSDSESNQNYCSHLIPVCVRRCRPGNEHVFQVVQSLLSNNERNTQLFYKSGGCRMFNREYLKYDRCLQLLNTVVSNPDVRDKILNDTDIIGDLKDLKQMYGSTSQNTKDSISIQKPTNKTDISSLSFLLNNNSVKSSTNINFKDEENDYDKSICSNKKIILKKSHCCKEEKKNTQKNIIDFKPKYASTPKQTKTNKSKNFTPRPIHKTYKKQYKNLSIDSKLKINTKSNKDESVQRRFGASRILDVINETCTTIMKSVTNVFRSKKREDSLNQSENSNSERQSQYANSFTNYMRQRDAMLEQNSTNSYLNDLMEEAQYECNTCNDTLSLKRKFSNDDFLKETVNKLKLGINLYGCNFKKISNTFWREENYMTPTVLYNLYRKLILK